MYEPIIDIGNFQSYEYAKQFLKMFKGLKILCLVPARKNSKGIKNKNIKKILNKELIFYPINAAKKSKLIDKLVFFIRLNLL